MRASLDELQALTPTACEKALLDLGERDADLAASLRELLAGTGGQFTSHLEHAFERLMPTEEAMPERVGPFRLREPIGSGGMRVIYLAEREHADFVQRVAIKLLDGGSAGLTLLAACERRILATLAHPKITAFVDQGCTGRIFAFHLNLIR